MSLWFLGMNQLSELYLGDTKVTYKGVKVLAEFLPDLVVLDISRCRLDDAQLFDTLSRFHLLEVLSIESSSLTCPLNLSNLPKNAFTSLVVFNLGNTNVTDADVTQLVAMRMHQLRQLTLSGCRSLTVPTLLAVTRGCRLLELFHLPATSAVFDNITMLLPFLCGACVGPLNPFFIL